MPTAKVIAHATSALLEAASRPRMPITQIADLLRQMTNELCVPHNFEDLCTLLCACEVAEAGGSHPPAVHGRSDPGQGHVLCTVKGMCKALDELSLELAKLHDPLATARRALSVKFDYCRSGNIKK